MTQPAVDGFATVLRQASAADHADAESAGYLRDLMSGRLPLPAYAALSVQLHAIYSVLEEAAEAQRRHPVAGRFVFDELSRTRALEEDLEALLGPGWTGRGGVLPATAAYVARLREVAFDWPGGFVAHHYVRYMGDLSGGRFIGRGIERAYGLQNGVGVRFFRFPDVPKPKLFKDGYRARLDAAPFDQAEQERIVAEVRLAYRLNTDLLAALGAEATGAAA